MKIRFIRVIRVLFFLWILSGFAFAQIRIGLHKSEYVLWVNQVAGDSAFVRIADDKGHTAKKISKEDFIVTRGADTATILSCEEEASSSPTGFAITFILDNSASMYHSYDSLTNYLDRFIDSLGDGFIANVITFDNTERLPTYDGTTREKLFIASSEFTSDRQAMKNFWHSYDTIRTDLTPLYETIEKGLERILDRRKSGDSLRREIVIVVTDGADNASPLTIERLSELASVMPITIFTLNYNSEPDARLNWLAKKTRGDYFIAENLWRLQRTLDDLRKDISSAYKLIFEFPLKGASGIK